MTSESSARARNIVIKHLESLRRAGVTHLMKNEAPQASESSPLAEQAVASSHLATIDPAPGPTVPRVERSLFGVQDSATGKDHSVTEDTHVKLSLADRQAKLEILAENVSGCTRCQELAETRTNTVFGVGNPEARVVFVGEAPGADEDRQGEPFVGRAGKLLNDIITACQMKREDIYICNILKCRPPGNRNPSTTEADACREYLDGQLETIDPEYIVCWGTVAAQNLLKTTTPIGKMRRKFYNHGRAKVLCTYHPSYLLRNPAAKKDVWSDMKLLLHEMGIQLP